MIFAAVGQLLAGWLFADFAAGFIHWWEDRCGELAWPIIGRLVVEPNRLHHAQPALSAPTLLGRNAVSWSAAAILGLLLVTGFGLTPFTIAAVLGGFAVNEVHALAHRGAPKGSWLAALQDTGLILSPAHHAGHHRQAHDRRYCVLTGWLNPILDRLGFWRGLEQLLSVAGMTPNYGTK